MPYEHILYEKREGIGWVTLNRPEVLNARNSQTRRELVAVCREIREDPEVKVMVLTGQGRAFSVGRDLREPFEQAGLAQARRSRSQDRDAEAVASLDKPVIAAINGYCLGGGCELSLACDLRIASDDAQIGLPEAKRGLMPGSGGTQRLPRLVGRSKALEMIFTGEPVSAQEAERVGLVNKVVPKDKLLEEAEALAKRIAANGPAALRFVKEAVNQGLQLSLEEGLRLETDLALLLGTTEDAEEGRKAFLEKRQPLFKGQ